MRVNDSKLFNGNFYFPVDGHFVSEKQVRINEILQDYDSTLQLQWIPPDQRGPEDKAFRVVQFPLGRAPYAICFADEADERLLAKVFEADQRNSPNKLSYIENYNNALELMRAKEAREQRQEDHELAASILRSEKSNYRHGGINFERPGGRDSRKTYIWR
ncbi:hypothetical protein ACFY7C_36620 [Streptomyces sp. NPDC012769]|uniref:hypothetical protein n=1 Tax=Streptomyces sp. NPDC012769 TaxID=3364848 RepID=UPI0036BC99D6